MKTFSDIGWVIDRQTGEQLPFEETITPEQNVFFDNGISTLPDNGEKLLLRLGLERLTKQQKQVIHGIYFEGKTQRQVAEDLGISFQAICSHHKRAMTKLREVCVGD